MFQKVLVLKDHKRLKKTAIQKRITNLFSYSRQQTLPPLLPQELRPVSVQVDDQLIVSQFAELGVQLEGLLPLVQPAHVEAGGYEDGGVEVINLICMALAYCKLKNQKTQKQE